MMGFSKWSISSIAACILAALSAAGCGSFSPKPDPSRFFTLSSLEETGVKNSGNPNKISLGIGPVRFPGYLDRQEIVIRRDENRFDVSEYDRWAEPLDENFTRMLSQNLAALLPADQIIQYPWPSSKKPNYQVEIEVLRFEVTGAREARLSARWQIIDGSDRNPAIVKESRLTRQAKDPSTDAAVAALSEAGADLSREIANAVRDMERRRK